MPEIFTLRQDPDYVLLIGGAQWIKEGNTLASKFKYLESLPDIELFEDAEKINEEIVHGVSETITLKCVQCGN